MSVSERSILDLIQEATAGCAWCGQPVIWAAHSTKGRRFPLNPDPEKQPGEDQYSLFDSNGKLIASHIDRRTQFARVTGYKKHLVTCPRDRHVYTNLADALTAHPELQELHEARRRANIRPDGGQAAKAFQDACSRLGVTFNFHPFSFGHASMLGPDPDFDSNGYYSFQFRRENE